MKNGNSAFEKIPKNPFQICSDLLRFGLNLENTNLHIYKSKCTDKMTIFCLLSENVITFFKVVLEKAKFSYRCHNDPPPPPPPPAVENK